MQEPQSDRPGRRSFWCLTVLQAQAAFSDNAFKQLMFLYAMLLTAERGAMQGKLNAVITGMFPVAYLVFSCWAGFLADKFSKRQITLATKYSEMGIMGLGALVFWVAGSSAEPSWTAFYLALGVLFLMYTQSAFFSPTKYGIIPEMVPTRRLGWANGVIGLTTFLAIILGLAAANEVFEYFRPAPETGRPGRVHWFMLGLVGMAFGGLMFGVFIRRTPRANPDRSVPLNFMPELRRYFGMLWADRVLTRTVLGLAYFWGVGALVLAHVPVWGKHALELANVSAGRLYPLLALGIGVGSILAGLLSRHRIEVGLVPLGALGIGVFSLPLGLASGQRLGLMIACMFMVGVSAGMFAVPLNAILQGRTALRDRGGLLAANNYATNIGILIGSGLLYLFYAIGMGPNQIFVVIGVLTLAGTAAAMAMLPQAFVKLINLLLTKLVYRIRTHGVDRIPEEGAALLVANHVSFVDALLVLAVSPRPVRFVVYKEIYEKWWLRWLLGVMGCIPISARHSQRELIRSLRAAGRALAEGELVCIFAEGQISRTGMMLPFRRGYQTILKEAPAPVVPIYLHGVWGSIFSYEGGKFFWKRPRRIPYPVRIVVGKPQAPGVSPSQLRQRIQELGAEAAKQSKADEAPLQRRLIQTGRRHWFRFAMIDTMSPEMNWGQVLWRTVILSRRLRWAWRGQEVVGVMLPPSVGASLVNYGAAMTGRTVVNLNYTAGQEIINDCAARAGVRTVVTSRTFLERTGLEAPAEPIYAEDHRGYRGLGEVFGAMLMARLAPAGLLERYCGRMRVTGPDTLASIIFSSGSTGQPKGVMLSHFNIGANVESFRQGIHVWRHDRLLGTLPLFHSFGYTVALWAPAIFPFGVVHHANPLDMKTIGELVRTREVTVVITTPTFLQAYERRIDPSQLGGINCIITGAERLPDRLRVGFLEKFGIEPLQGYGTTECSPVVATNVNDHRAPGECQIGHKRGSIGVPLPGIAVRIIDPETGRRRPEGEPGLVHVYGPNIMQGYLDMPEATEAAVRDGWYNTGDIGYMDEDGFIFLTGRQSRFSKIGGEMVPHVMIEDKLHEVLELDEQRLVVTAITDERRGEVLVVLHTLEEELLEGIGEKLAAAGLPNLWIPRREHFYRIEELPTLGTGKLDLKEVERQAHVLVFGNRNGPAR